MWKDPGPRIRLRLPPLRRSRRRWTLALPAAAALRPLQRGRRSPDALHGWAAGRGGILGTADAGATWRLQSPAAALDAVDGRTAWALSGRALLRTTDGTHWRRAGAPGLAAIDFVDRSNGFALGPGGGLRKTADGGATWRPCGPARSRRSVSPTTTAAGSPAAARSGEPGTPARPGPLPAPAHERRLPPARARLPRTRSGRSSTAASPPAARATSSSARSTQAAPGARCWRTSTPPAAASRPSAPTRARSPCSAGPPSSREAARRAGTAAGRRPSSARATAAAPGGARPRARRIPRRARVPRRVARRAAPRLRLERDRPRHPRRRPHLAHRAALRAPGGPVILGLETSCDETAAALITDDGRILANVVASQADLHAPLRRRRPRDRVAAAPRARAPVIHEALAEAGATLDDVDASPSRSGPGLIGALLVGAHRGQGARLGARPAARRRQPPAGHVASLYLEPDALEPPFVCLLASGGHTMLLDVRERGRLRAARHDARRRRRRGVRQGRAAARARLPRRRGDRPARARGRPGGVRLPRRPRCPASTSPSPG